MQAESFRCAAGGGTTPASRRRVWCRVDDLVRPGMGAVTVTATARAAVTWEKMEAATEENVSGVVEESWACGSMGKTRGKAGPQLLTWSEA